MTSAIIHPNPEIIKISSVIRECEIGKIDDFILRKGKIMFERGEYWINHLLMER